MISSRCATNVSLPLTYNVIATKGQLFYGCYNKLYGLKIYNIFHYLYSYHIFIYTSLKLTDFQEKILLVQKSKTL